MNFLLCALFHPPKKYAEKFFQSICISYKAFRIGLFLKTVIYMRYIVNAILYFRDNFLDYPGLPLW